MPITRLLIANRGEIAIRIARSAADLGLRSVAVHSRDDARSLHVRAADEVRELPGQGAAAYLDAGAIIAAAEASGCDAIHPGYGFLSEMADFARRCAKAALIFVGPAPAHPELFGDKARARTAAVAADVSVIRGMDRAVSLKEAQAFFSSLHGGAMIIKAVAGGGWRDTRAVLNEAEIEPAYQRCRSEAKAAFGCGDVYVEQYPPRPPYRSADPGRPERDRDAPRRTRVQCRGGLGIYTPEEVGPMSVQVPNGVVDILVKDEDEVAVDVARKYLSCFQGPLASWEAHDQRRLRHIGRKTACASTTCATCLKSSPTKARSSKSAQNSASV
jgi:hypothetical protein